MKVILHIIIIVACYKGVDAVERLQAVANHFEFDGSPVYLSGLNQAWNNFARDFGNHGYHDSYGALEDILRDINSHGGNSIRIWVHTDSEHTPKFDNTGHVTAADKYCDHIIQEMGRYLCVAQDYDVFVFFVLWNGADWNFSWGQQLNGLITEDTKLQSYIDHALVPIVNALKDFPSLGGYEIMNEPEGIVIVTPNLAPCKNTQVLMGSGAGWKTCSCMKGSCFFMDRLQRFINWQADAIKKADPKALVTLGSWRENAQYSGAPNGYNFYSDSCLVSAGGRSLGVLDFYQIHTYADVVGTSYSTNSPMEQPASFYNLNKPLVIGEYSSSGGDGSSNEELAMHAYVSGYAGAWSWHADESGTHADFLAMQLTGLLSLFGAPYIDVHLGVCTLTVQQLNSAIAAKPFFRRFCRRRAELQVFGTFNG